MTPQEALLYPVLSEKSTDLKDMRKYVFIVHPKANKMQIRWAVASTYNVKVLNCRIIRCPRKKKRQGRHVGFTSARKKAIVSLAEGQSIPLFEGA